VHSQDLHFVGMLIDCVETHYWNTPPKSMQLTKYADAVSAHLSDSSSSSFSLTTTPATQLASPPRAN
jgi:hypothetical protein